MDTTSASLRTAAEYVRMSTDQQVCSIDNQRDAIRAYAARNGLSIVRTFTDEGRSGLTFSQRPGLKSLLAEVVGGLAEFDLLIVYDISRWGRFQDVDESAHYEYLCRRAGVGVVYCAEPFLNETNGFAAAMKGMKRAMAAEYSRELSEKVFAGQRRLVGLGFRQGGRPGLGFRRRLVDASGADKGLLQFGERKSIQSDRVVLALGPPDEVELVRRIFRMFVNEGLGEEVIARALNAEGLKSDCGRRWRPETVHCLLTNEKYTGNALFGKTRGRLHAPRRRVIEDQWVRVHGAHPAIIEAGVFAAAQKRIAARRQKLEDEVMLEALKRVWNKHGRISDRLINRTRGAPKSYLYKSRFGGLLPAYRMIGFEPSQDSQFRTELQALRRLTEDTIAHLILRFENQGARVRRSRTTLEIDGLRLELQFVRPKLVHGNLRWFPRREAPDIDLLALVRMTSEPMEPLDVFLLPPALQGRSYRLNREGNSLLEAFRFPDLTVLEELLSCAPFGLQIPVQADIARKHCSI